MSSLKTGVELPFFGLKSSQDLKNREAHPHEEFPGVPPPASGLKSQTFLNSDRPNVRAEARETFAKRAKGSDEVARLVTLKKLSRSVEKV